MRGPFLDRWNGHGALAVNGFPLTDERTEVLEDGRSYLVQWFERVRMELHPENQPPYDLLLGQFGRILHPPDFLARSEADGRQDQFGFPLSEVIQERLEDGNLYEVQ